MRDDSARASATCTEVFVKEHAEVHRRRRWLQLICFPLASALPLGLASLPRARPDDIFRLMALLLCTSIACFALDHAWRRWPTVSRVKLRADSDGLWLGGARAVPRSAFRAGWVSRRGRVFVRLMVPHGSLDVFVDHEGEGQALLSALRLDRPRSVARYLFFRGTRRQRLARFFGAFVPFLGLYLVALLLHWPWLDRGAPSLILFGVAVAVISRQYVTVSVGADGVRVSSWTGRPEFVRYIEMEGIERDGKTITLQLRRGERLVWQTGSRRISGRDANLTADALVSRVAGAIAAHRGEPAANPWASRMRAARAGECGPFRRIAVPAEALWEVIEAASAEPQLRIDAARALGASLDEAGRARLRLIADACANPAVRDALRRVSATADASARSEPPCAQYL